MTKVRLMTENVVGQIQRAMETASTICILTSFIMKSGVEVLKPYLLKVAQRGAEIKICCGDYLYVTQPDALKELIHIDKRIEARLWKSNGTSFHPKAYIFESAKDGFNCWFLKPVSICPNIRRGMEPIHERIS